MGQKQCILFSKCFPLVGLVLSIMTKAYTGRGGNVNKGMAHYKITYLLCLPFVFTVLMRGGYQIFWTVRTSSVQEWQGGHWHSTLVLRSCRGWWGLWSARVCASAKGRSSYSDLAHWCCAETWVQIGSRSLILKLRAQYLLVFKVL